MGFLRRLLGGPSDGDESGPARTDDLDPTVATEATFDANAQRHRVTVWIRVHDAAFENEREQLRVLTIENRIMAALDAAGVGEHDTNTLEPGYFAMRLYGDDAAAIAATIEPLLSDVPAGSYIAVRSGPVSTGEERIELGGAD